MCECVWRCRAARAHTCAQLQQCRVMASTFSTPQYSLYSSRCSVWSTNGRSDESVGEHWSVVTWLCSITWRRDSDDDDDATGHWSEPRWSVVWPDTGQWTLDTAADTLTDWLTDHSERPAKRSVADRRLLATHRCCCCCCCLVKAASRHSQFDSSSRQRHRG